MKPSFALNFTDSSIGLLHRTTRGWLEVGSVGFDEPDLASALAYLRGSALGLEPHGITTKLVIPNSQIRYMTLAAPGPDAASRRAQIREALEGKTPYAVDDLVFDWSGTGKSVQVAVVARETLQEAESFARDNRFNPVSFVAIPESGTFGAEPWFGLSTLAPSLLADGEKVERDQDPIKVVGRAPKAEPSPSAGVLSDVASAPSDPATSEVAPVVVAEAVPAPQAVQPTESDVPLSPSPSPQLESEVAEEVKTASKAPEETSASEPDSFSATPEPAPVTARSRVTETVIADQIDPLDADLADLPPIPPARIQAALRAAEAAKGEPRTADGAKKSQPAAGKANGPKPGPKGTEVRPSQPPPVPRLTALPGGGGGAGARSTKIVPVEAEWPLERVAAAARPGKVEATRGGPVITAPSIPLPRDRKLTVVPREDATAQIEPKDDKRRTEAETMTVFGARQTARRGKPRYLFLILVVLLLAVLASVFIWSSIVQAYRGEGQPSLASAEPGTQGGSTAAPAEEAASVPLPDPSSTPDAGIVEASSPSNPDIDGTLSKTVPDGSQIGADQVASQDENAADEKSVASALDTVPDASATAAPEAAAEAQPAPAPLDGEALAAATDSEGQNRTPGNEAQDEIYLALVENPIATDDAIALAAPAVGVDALPGAQPLPPPFGTLYQFDEQGRIKPTPEGIVTPEGVRLVSGKPPRVPPVRPEPPALEAEQPASAEVKAEAVPEPAFADPALAGARPRLRPEGLVAPSTPEASGDGAAATVAETTQVTSLKPRARPPELLARGEAELSERTAKASADAQATSASLLATLDDAGATSPLAVAVSRKPAARPAVLDRSIEAAVQVAVADASIVPEAALLAPQAEAIVPAEPQPVLAAPAPAAPIAKAPTLRLSPEEEKPTAFSKEEANDPAVVEVDEPESAGKTASGSTRSIVAKKATYANALNMSKISLIGVFGSPSNRYAMVRQPGGRFVKVEVGDRIDGGRIAAISEREVSYVKNGQTHTLSLPKG